MFETWSLQYLFCQWSTPISYLVVLYSLVRGLRNKHRFFNFGLWLQRSIGFVLLVSFVRWAVLIRGL